MEERLHRFFVRNDAEYETWVQQYHAKTLAGNFSGQHRLGSDHRSLGEVNNCHRRRHTYPVTTRREHPSWKAISFPGPRKRASNLSLCKNHQNVACCRLLFQV